MTALRQLLQQSGFGTLDELGNALRPRRTRQRLSELARGTCLPDHEELKAIVFACQPGAWRDMQNLLNGARAEQSALGVEAPLRNQSDPRLTCGVSVLVAVV